MIEFLKWLAVYVLFPLGVLVVIMAIAVAIWIVWVKHETGG